MGSQVKLAAAQRAAKEARERLGNAEDELARLRARAAAGEDASGKLAARQEQLTAAKRALRQRDDDLREAVAGRREAEAAQAALADEARQAASRNTALEVDVAKTRAQLEAALAGQRRGGAGGMYSGLVDGEEVARLREENQQLRRQMASLEQQQQPQSGQGRQSGLESSAELEAAKREVRRLQDRLSRASGGIDEAATLRAENAKLREELSAFDLDFFEEIEDLKYKYAEATRRLRQYEN